MSTSSSLLQRATARLSRSRPWALPPPKLAVASSLPTPKIAVASSLPFSATVSFGTTPMVTRSRQVKPTRTNIPPPFPDTILASARALARENRSRPWRPSHPTTSAAPVKPSAVPLRTPSGPFRTPAAAKFGLQSFSQWVLTQPLYNVNPRPLSRPSSHFGDETLELIKNVLVFDKPSAPTSSPPAAPKRRVRFLSSSFAPPRVLRSILKKPGSDNHQAKRVTFAKRAKRIRVLRWIGVLDHRSEHVDPDPQRILGKLRRWPQEENDPNGNITLWGSGPVSHQWCRTSGCNRKGMPYIGLND